MTVVIKSFVFDPPSVDQRTAGLIEFEATTIHGNIKYRGSIGDSGSVEFGDQQAFLVPVGKTSRVKLDQSIDFPICLVQGVSDSRARSAVIRALKQFEKEYP